MTPEEVLADFPELILKDLRMCLEFAAYRDPWPARVGEPMNEQQLTTREEFFHWLRSFPLVSNIGQASDLPEVIEAGDSPMRLNSPFWSERTQEIEADARLHLSDPEIDRVFDDVAAIIDEDLRRFDPLVAYYGRFSRDGDPARIEDERQAAHGVKRDLAWAAVELSIGRIGFFSKLLPWYDRGRWPCSWAGTYPSGYVLESVLE